MYHSCALTHTRCMCTVCVYMYVSHYLLLFVQPSYSNTDRYQPESTISKIKDTLDFICNQCFVVSNVLQCIK